MFIGLLIENLEKEKDILNRDNITLEIEINNLNDVVKKLDLEYEKGILLKNEINELVKTLNDNEKKYMQNNLETLEKKLFDLRQMALIKEQSRLALEIICRNNKEIIRNIERVKNITVVALNTAVIVAKSLYKQKITLSKIQMLEDGTDSMFQETARVLKEDGVKIYEIATKNKPEDMLIAAFKDVFETLNVALKQNEKVFPENENKIIELKKMEGSYE